MIVAFTTMISSTVNEWMYVSYKSTSCGNRGNAQARRCQMQKRNIHE